MPRLLRRTCLRGATALLAACGREAVPAPSGWPYPSPRQGPAPDPSLAWAFDASGFEPMSAPQPGEWLSEQVEAGQDVVQFLEDGPNRPEAPRDTIVVAPLRMPHSPADVISTMRPRAGEIVDYLGRFFGLPVRLGDTVRLEGRRVGIRRGRTHARAETDHEQWNATDINEALLEQLPDDAYCCIGVTTTDLFPEPGWNFVFGQANLTGRVGVFSLARYDDAFFGRSPSDPVVVRRRGLGVVAHEVGHMFGMQHCVYHRCLLNGSNNQDEADRCPLHVCPVCLRKLHLLVRFDPAARYRALADFYGAHGLEAEAQWVRSRLSASSSA